MSQDPSGDSEAPDELPLSSESDIPDELALDDDESSALGELGHIQELSLSPECTPQSAHVDNQAATSAGEPSGHGGLEAAEEEESEVMIPEIAPVSVFKRRGRPNKDLQWLMRDLLGTGAEAPRSSSPAGVASRGATEASESSAVALATTTADLKALVKRTDLPSDWFERPLLKRPILGLCPLPEVAGCLEAVAEMIAVAGKEAVIDLEVVKVFEEVLQNDKWHLASQVVLAEKLGVDRYKLSAAIPQLAGALYLSSRAKRTKLESDAALQVPREGLLLFIELCAYDETPLPVRMQNESGHTKGTQRPSSGALVPWSESQTHHMSVLSRTSTLLAGVRNVGGQQKILQTFQESGFILKRGDAYIMVVGGCVCPLQVLDRCTAPALEEAQLRISSVSRGASCFQDAMRIVCTDANAANTAAERMIVKERCGWSALHTQCEIHKTSACHVKTFVLLDDNVRGMVHCALSLRQGAAMTRFRRCLGEEVASRFEVKAGAPPRDAQEHKRKLLRLFASHGPSLPTRHVLLALCPNGDWRAPRVQHFVPARELGKVDRAAVMAHVTGGLLTALCARQPDLYPRHRWTGADIATDMLGLLESCHNLLSTTYLRFAASFEARSRASRILAGVADVGGARMQPAGENPALEGAGEAAGDGGDAGDAGRVGQDPDAPDQPDATEGSSASWAAVNTMHRRMATEWILRKPLTEMIVQRQVMEPLRRMLAAQFEVAGEAWDIDQAAKVLDGSATEGTINWACREYRLVIAATCQEEKRFFQQLHLLFEEPVLWSALPAKAFTLHYRALVFKMLSRMGCCVQELHQHPHEQLPFQLFRLLREPELAGQLLQIPTCRWDAWSMAMREKHPALADADFYAKLAAVALMAWKDISRIEAKHASIRRILYQRSTHTHSLEFGSLSADWCFLQARRGSQRMMGAARDLGKARRAHHRSSQHSSKAHRPTMNSGTPPNGVCNILVSVSRLRFWKKSDGCHSWPCQAQVKKKATKQRGRRGWGGPWRAYIRKVTLGQKGKPDFKKLRASYDEDIASGKVDIKALRIAGAAARAVGKSAPPTKGASAFGPQGRHLKLRGLQDLRASLRAFAQSEELDFCASGVGQQALRAGVGLADCLSLARSAMKARAAEARQRREKNVSLLQAFEEDLGKQKLAAAIEEFPWLATASARPEPAPGGLLLRVGGPDLDKLKESVAWAYASKASKLSAGLAGTWSELHSTLMEKDCGSCAAPGDPPATECLTAGVCLCSASGRRLKQLRTRLYASMKKSFAPGTPHRDLLSSACVVLRITGSPPRPGVDTMGDQATSVDFFFHIGLMYWSPYRPTMMRVLPVEGAQGDTGNTNRIYVKAP